MAEQAEQIRRLEAHLKLAEAVCEWVEAYRRDLLDAAHGKDVPVLATRNTAFAKLDEWLKAKGGDDGPRIDAQANVKLAMKRHAETARLTRKLKGGE
jgi:hypothetical protein